jgi:bla regulator protein BlaR1
MDPVLSHLWQSTLFAGAVWVLTLALRKNRASTRYCVWLAASMKFLIPFSMLIAIGSRVEWKSEPVAVRTNAARAMAQMERPFSTGVPGVIPVENETNAGALRDLFLLVWAGGFVGLSVRWNRVRDAARRAKRLAIHGEVEVLSSADMLEPGVFGILRPVLLLPEGITEILTREQMQAIVSHEMCHVRRRDNLATAIHMVVETVFWFHPLVWWLGGRLVEERERACDEEVLRLGSDPVAYAEGILRVCEYYFALPVDCVAGRAGGPEEAHRGNYGTENCAAVEFQPESAVGRRGAVGGGRATCGRDSECVRDAWSVAGGKV